MKDPLKSTLPAERAREYEALSLVDKLRFELYTLGLWWEFSSVRQFFQSIKEKGIQKTLSETYYQSRFASLRRIRKNWYTVPEDEFDSSLESDFAALMVMREEEREKYQANLMLRREIAHQEDFLKDALLKDHPSLISQIKLIESLRRRLRESRPI